MTQVSIDSDGSRFSRKPHDHSFAPRASKHKHLVHLAVLGILAVRGMGLRTKPAFGQRKIEPEPEFSRKEEELIWTPTTDEADSPQAPSLFFLCIACASLRLLKNVEPRIEAIASMLTIDERHGSVSMIPSICVESALRADPPVSRRLYKPCRRAEAIHL